MTLGYELNEALVKLARAAAKALSREPRELTASQIRGAVESLAPVNGQDRHELTVALLSNPSIVVVPDPTPGVTYR